MADYHMLRVPMKLWAALEGKVNATLGEKPSQLALNYLLHGISGGNQVPEEKKEKEKKINNKVLKKQRYLFYCEGENDRTRWIDNEEEIDFIFLFFQNKVSKEPGFEDAIHALNTTIIHIDDLSIVTNDERVMDALTEAAIRVRDLRIAYHAHMKKSKISDEVTYQELDQTYDSRRLE